MASNQFPPLPFPDPAKFKLNPSRLLLGVGALTVAIGVLSSFYQVPTNSVGVVQRFGAYSTTTQPGLQFKLPFGIDSVTIVEQQRQLKLEFGYASGGASNPYQYAETYEEQEGEKNMVTGDLNAAVVEWAVQFHVSDAKDFVFQFREPEETLRDLSEAVMREVVGDRTVDEVLTIGRQEMEEKALVRLQQIVTTLDVGIHIDQIQLRNVDPPGPVKNSFDEVNRAQQEKDSMINTANGEYNKVVPRASGEAEQKISEAEGYALKRVNEAEGDATRFNALLTEYKKAPEVTRTRLYLETMSEILPTVPGKVILDEKAPQFLPMMHLRQNEAQTAPVESANPVLNSRN